MASDDVPLTDYAQQALMAQHQIRVMPPSARRKFLELLLTQFCFQCGYELRPWEQAGCTCAHRPDAAGAN